MLISAADRLKEDLGTHKWDFSLPENISLGNYNDIFGRFYCTVKENFTSHCLKTAFKNPRSKRSTPIAPLSPKVNRKEAEPLEEVQKKTK